MNSLVIICYRIGRPKCNPIVVLMIIIILANIPISVPITRAATFIGENITKDTILTSEGSPYIVARIKEEAIAIAEKAAEYVINRAIAEKAGFKWASQHQRYVHYNPVFQDGAAGVGYFLLNLYKITGKQIYLKYAEGAARWIINTAFRKSGPGSYVEYNPYHQAAFGIYSYVQRDVGTLMIELYKATNKSVYLERAVEIARWVIYTAEFGNISGESDVV